MSITRIKQLMDAKGLTPRRLAEELDVSYGTLYNWYKGTVFPRPGINLEKIAKRLNVSVSYLLATETDETMSFVSDDGYVLIPYIEATASCGSGFVNGEYQPLVKLMKVSSDWLRIHAPYANRNRLNVIVADGDSMLPTIKPGDMVIVDRSQFEAKVDGIYVYCLDDALYIKRLQRLPNGFKVVSDNSVYEPFTIEAEDISRLRILGRVLCVGKFDSV